MTATRSSAYNRRTASFLAVLAFSIIGMARAAVAAPAPGKDALIERATRVVDQATTRVVSWYRSTEPADRVTTGGLVACGLLGASVLLERLARVRRRKYLPGDFMRRYDERLKEGKLDRGKALDLCELNPSPAAKVALAAIKRWGRPVSDLDRAVSLAIRLESDRLHRHVGTLRRLAVMTPLLGLLGTLLTASRILNQPQVTVGQAVSMSLWPLTAGVGMAILFMVAYDGFVGRVEGILATLDRLGSETVDAIAMAAPAETPKPAAPAETTAESRFEARQPARSYNLSRPSEPRRHSSGPRTPHQIRVDIPDAMIRAMEQDDDLYDV